MVSKNLFWAMTALVSLAAATGCDESAPAPAPSTPAASAAPPQGSAKPSAGEPAAAGSVEVMLCDGKTKAEFPAGTQGSTVASALMAEWMRKNPNANWEVEERERHALQPSADNSGLIGQSPGGDTYGRVTAQDVELWKVETERLATAGSAVFHNGDALGSTVGVSCDMCHPHAANTHPETYPKYQAQLGHVVLLRDMINWCIEHPVRGKALSADDPKMRAMEGYILAQRKGKVLEYGKH